MRLFTLLFLIVSSSIFLAHYFLIGQAVYGDGRFYYSYARSLALQGDLDIKEELTHRFSPQENNTKSSSREEFAAYPVQSLGPAVFWSPVIAIAHIIAKKNDLLANGYSDIYQISAGLISIAFASLALHRLGTLLLKHFKPSTVFLVLILTWAGSNLFFYTSIDNLNTHFFSFSLASFALSEYLLMKNPSMLLMGIITGLAFQNRQLDLLLHLSLFLAYFKNDRRISSAIKYLLSVILIALPQFLVWKYQFGSFLPAMAGNTFWRIDPLSLLRILFSLPQGLLFTAPALFLSLAILFKHLQNIYLRYTSISLVLFLVITSFWWSPMGGAAYGPRFLIVYYPLLAYSLSALIEKVSTKKAVIFTVPVILLSLINTFIFLYQSP